MAEVLRELRHAAGLTQGELARRAGISLAAVRDLEQGRTRSPRARSLNRIAMALGLDSDSTDELARVAKTTVASRAASTNKDGSRPGDASGTWLRILGPISAWRDGAALHLGGPKQRAILGLLAALANSLVHRETIIDALWPDGPPTGAVQLVQAHVSRLRRVLAVSAPHSRVPLELVSTGASYCLRSGPGQLDLLAFTQAVEAARAACRTGDFRAACDAYGMARGLWRGRPLADVDVLRHHPVVLAIVRELDDVVIEYSRVALPVGWHGRVLPLLWELHAREPLNEQALAQLVLGLAGSSKQAEALRVYERARRRLRDELGILPGPELRDAHQRVLRQDIAVTAVLATGCGS
jgi:DNA-binding SARP family transcriptional activator/DNA-binding XRE family transcriptional regulator